MPLAAALWALAQAGAVPPPAAPKCASHEPGAIVVCGPGPHPYRIDPDVSTGQRAADHDANSATASIPAAQAACADSPMGCGKGLEGLDLINLAVLAGTMAVDAATGRTGRGRCGRPDRASISAIRRQSRSARRDRRTWPRGACATKPAKPPVRINPDSPR